MTESTRKRRTVQERLAEAQAEVQRLQAKEAEEEFSESAPISYLSKELASIAENAAQAKKGLTSTNPNQSFAKRRESHQIWIDEIDALEAAANTVMEYHDAAQPIFLALTAEAVEMLKNGDSEEEVESFVQSQLAERLENCSEIAEEAKELSAKASAATQARKTYIANKRNGGNTSEQS